MSHRRILATWEAHCINLAEFSLHLRFIIICDICHYFVTVQSTMGTLSTNPYRTLYTWAISKLPSHDIVEKNLPISSGQTLILVKYSFACYTLFPYATCRGYARWHYIHGSFICVQPCRLGGWRMVILWLYETGLSHHSQRGALCMHGWSSRTCRPYGWGLELYKKYAIRA